ncbi:MAG: hypothetical protein AAF321_04225 [Pseudomonadota bacterium]
MQTSRASDAFWRRVRARYENESISVKALADAEGITRARLYGRARREGWVGRRLRRAEAARRQEEAEWRARVGARLMELTDEVSALMAPAEEARRTGEGRDDDIDLDEGGRDAGRDDIERRVKALSGLTRIVQAVDRLLRAEDAGSRAQESAGLACDEPETDELDRLRAELQRRLDRAAAAG